MTLDELLGLCREMGLPRLGSNSRLILSELARHLDVPTDAVSINIVRRNAPRGAAADYSVWHWGIYSEERIARYREIPGRRWNSSCHCNSFSIVDDNDPAFVGMLKELFNKSVIIGDTAYRIEEGEAAAEWIGKVLYELGDQPYPVNLKNVLDGFFKLRPNDQPYYLTLHGEIDPEFRTLFGRGLQVDTELPDDLELRTRHKLLLFRISVTHGRLRYLLYSAEHNTAIEVLFAESKETARMLSMFKETQQRLAHPLLERDSALAEKLRDYGAKMSQQ